MTALPPCACQKMTRKLKELGAVHAAKMHDQSADGHVHRWSAHDWELHFREEERLIFPLLPREVARRLARDHAMFRRQLRTTGTLDPKRMAIHARLEDLLVMSLPPVNRFRPKTVRHRRAPRRKIRSMRRTTRF